jgi:hypothetical protein
VFGISRKQYGQGKEKKKKKSNIVKWVCDGCGDVVRSSKPVVFMKCCKPVFDENGDMTGEFCDSFFTREDGVTVQDIMKMLKEEEEKRKAEAEGEGEEPADEVSAGKPEIDFEYENQEKRYNEQVCPSCPWFTGTHCRRHVSNVERKQTVTKTYEVRPLNLENPYTRKDTCDLQNHHINTYYRLDEDR